MDRLRLPGLSGAARTLEGLYFCPREHDPVPERSLGALRERLSRPVGQCTVETGGTRWRHKVPITRLSVRCVSAWAGLRVASPPSWASRWTSSRRSSAARASRATRRGACWTYSPSNWHRRTPRPPLRLVESGVHWCTFYPLPRPKPTLRAGPWHSACTTDGSLGTEAPHLPAGRRTGRPA